MTGIYCIENTVNHKKYIGMAQDVRIHDGKTHWCIKRKPQKSHIGWEQGQKHPWLNKPVIHIETGETFKSISEASEKTGFSISGICDVCIKRRKTIYKQHFQFIEG